MKENPFKNKRLAPPFVGCFKAKAGKYRIVYLPNQETEVIIIVDIDLRKRVWDNKRKTTIIQIARRILSQK